MIRILIADDHTLMREGLKALLAQAKDIEVVGEAEDGQSAVELALQTEPDVVLMDMAMPGVDGARATETLRELSSKTRILFLSAHADPLNLQHALMSGAHGYLIKMANPHELPVAIRAVHRGEMYFSPEVFSYVSEEIAKHPQIRQMSGAHSPKLDGDHNLPITGS